MSLKDKLRFFLVFAGACFCGCGDYGGFYPEPGRPQVKVVLAVGEGSQTKTTYNIDTKRFEWNPGDELAVWAKSSAGTYVLDGRPFNLLAVAENRSSAYFTASLEAPMEEGTYSYYVAYPSPVSVDGTIARFVIPAVQDGTASGGVDVIVAEPVSGPALAPIAEAAPVLQDGSPKISMKHLLHFLEFYIPDGNNPFGEPLTRIEFSMPKPVVGDLKVDVTDAGLAVLENGTNSVALDLVIPLDGAGSAVAGIFPPPEAYSSEDQMAVTVYSENKWAVLNPFRLAGRTFSSGHLTPVPLRPTVVNELCQLKFTLVSNNLGEDPQNIKVSLPQGETWPGTDSNVLDFTGAQGGLVKVGDTFVLKVKDVEAFRNLSSKPLTVSYESESAIVSESLTLGDLSSVSSTVCDLNCPYLFFEDFSGVEDQSSYDEWSMSNPGSRGAKSFLNGWSAARFGTEAGTSLRLACRRETSADYTARADSPFLSGLKDGVTVSLEVGFNYSMDRQEYATPLVKLPEVSQTVKVGYITTSDNFDSGDDDGNFQSSFTINETGGSYTNIGHSYSTELTNVTSPLRLSWLTAPQHKAGTTNSTCWLYIDNIKVKIKK